MFRKKQNHRQTCAETQLTLMAPSPGPWASPGPLGHGVVPLQLPSMQIRWGSAEGSRFGVFFPPKNLLPFLMHHPQTEQVRTPRPCKEAPSALHDRRAAEGRWGRGHLREPPSDPRDDLQSHQMNFRPYLTSGLFLHKCDSAEAICTDRRLCTTCFCPVLSALHWFLASCLSTATTKHIQGPDVGHERDGAGARCDRVPSAASQDLGLGPPGPRNPSL